MEKRIEALEKGQKDHMERITVLETRQGMIAEDVKDGFKGNKDDHGALFTIMRGMAESIAVIREKVAHERGWKKGIMTRLGLVAGAGGLGGLIATKASAWWAWLAHVVH